MSLTRKMPLVATLMVAAGTTLVFPAPARAHCDTLDGPVVVAARRAIETGKVEAVLGWVQPSGEAELRAAFARTIAARKASADARSLADTWFFETVVRVHRDGEGASYTGLKPAGLKVEPAIALADRAVESGDVAALERALVDHLRHGLHEKFEAMRAKKPGKDASVADVRAWVAEYVTFIHYAEGIHAATVAGPAHAHAEAAAEPAPSAQPKPAARHTH